MSRIFKISFYAILFLFCVVHIAPAQTKQGVKNVILDKDGVLRWADSQEEVKGFGVNYTLPFAHAYRTAKKLGVDVFKQIDSEVYHFSRLGFDLYRIHVWDTEISDTLGNVLDNEHLRAFDYLLKKLSERNINYVITPIAYWGNGWPEPAEHTPGFSFKYGKEKCLTSPEAIDAQANYLSQFMNHKNQFTGTVFKNDPHLIAIEISNEPHHREAPEKVALFINRMVEAVRSVGYQKPVFYNTSHSVHLAKTYFGSNIQGGTFQWYPTGLGYGKELQGNFLPNVDEYKIPFDNIIREAKKGKIVYEFDAADVGKSYIYPAIARSFRKAGIQIATHFAYDPTFLAFANTEYNTHYMNLAYTPGKALSLKICSEVFHQIPRYKDFGIYPQDRAFGDFYLSYDDNLALLNSNEKYFYTNKTDAKPKDETKLKSIAGVNDSPIVKYKGTGAYFLDKLEDGLWRLEVMPDVLIVKNPYAIKNNLGRKVAVIQWNTNEMEIDLKDLGVGFKVEPINEGNQFQPQVSKNQFTIRPGAYFVSRAGKKINKKAADKWNHITLGEFYAPKSSVDKIYLLHQAPSLAVADEPLTIEVKMIAPNSIQGTDTTVQLQIPRIGREWKFLDMQYKGRFTYTATIPKEWVEKGFLKYFICVKNGKKVQTFPADKAGYPYDWNFFYNTPYSVRVVDKSQPFCLFDAEQDGSSLSFSKWSKDNKLTPADVPNESIYEIHLAKDFFKKDEENTNASIVYDYTIKAYLKDKIKYIRKYLSDKKKLVIKAVSLEGKAQPVQIALVTKDGLSYGKVIEIGTELKTYEIPLSELVPVKTVLMPRPYPTFLPYYSHVLNNKKLSLEDIEGIQISIDVGLAKEHLEDKRDLGIAYLMLE